MIHNKDYEDLIIRVEDLITNVINFNSFKILYFVNEPEQAIILSCLNHYDNVKCKFVSQIENSELKVAVFSSQNVDTSEIEVTKLFKIRYNSKFNQIDHRDVLGSLMALNIKRNHIGSIVVEDDYLYFEALASLTKYLAENLTKIKRVNVKLEECNDLIMSTPTYQEFQGIIKSYRLDNVVKLITKLSSAQTKDYILTANVKVNQIETTNFSKPCNDSDIISLKGYGRFKLIIDDKITKKGNYVVKYLKYV